MTIREAAQQAIDVQNACNLSGVVAAMHTAVMDVLWPEARRIGQGTSWVNTHPIVYLYLDKLASLNGTQCLCSDNLNSYSKAYAKVEAMATAENENNGVCPKCGLATVKPDDRSPWQHAGSGMILCEGTHS